MTSSLPALLWQCQTDTETATNLTSLSLPLSIAADWDHAADECLFQCHPSPTRKRGRCRHHHSRQHRGGLPSPPISADTHTPRAALAPCLRGTNTRTLTPQPLSQLLRVAPCEAQSQAQSSRHCASSAGNGTAAKTKRELFSFPIFENKPSLSFPAEGAGQCRREGGWGEDEKARVSVLQVKPETHRNQYSCWWGVKHPPPPPSPVTQSTRLP